MVLCAQQVDIESRYKQIDEAIAESPRYVAQREAKITAARHAFEQSSGHQKYEESYRLFELYRPFVSDSAIYFLRQCIDIAKRQGDYNASVRCQSQLAIRCSNIGLYDEALNILDSIRLDRELDKLVLGTYYEAYNNVYGELSYQFNEHWEAHVYGQKNIAGNTGYIPGLYSAGYWGSGFPPYWGGAGAVDRIGAGVRYMPNPSLSFEVNVENVWLPNQPYLPTTGGDFHHQVNSFGTQHGMPTQK